MDVVIYKAKGKNGYLYDMSFNPYVDFEILKNTRKVERFEVLTPKIPIKDAEIILRNIYGKFIFKKFVSTHDYFINRGLRRLKIEGISKHITMGIKIPPSEEIAKIEECITGKVVSVRKLIEMKDEFLLTEQKMMDIIQTLYCERRIRIISGVRKKRSTNICSFCEKKPCNECSLGFKSDDVLLYAADNYNIRSPRSIGYKKQKMSESQNKAALGIRDFACSSKKNSAILWCVPGGFEYNVLGEALAYFLKNGGKILYITSPSLVLETELGLKNLIDGGNISSVNKNLLNFKDIDIVICSYNDYPCFHKAFDFVIYDERLSFIEKPLKNMLLISNRAVKEKGKLLNITCSPEFKNKARGAHTPELITIPVTYMRCPIPEPLIVVSRLLKENIPQIVIDTIKWSLDDNVKIIIFVPNEEGLLKVYNNLINVGGVQRECIGFSNSKDKASLIKLRNKEVQIIISADFSDAKHVIEDVNVVVMYADDVRYNRATLIYMASMAAFHTKKKCGQVIFATATDTEDVSSSKERIRGINKIAWENGYMKK